MGKAFLNLMSMEQARELLQSFKATEIQERVDLEQAVGRVLAEEIESPEALPSFPRSLMDGYALRASDVASARETAPVILQVVGQVHMGQAPEDRIEAGQAMAIPTGAMLPPGADAVLMVEHSRLWGASGIEASRAVAPGDHVLAEGDDLPRGAPLLPKGQRLAPLDLGLCAACGLMELPVFARPKVAILSTGD